MLGKRGPSLCLEFGHKPGKEPPGTVVPNQLSASRGERPYWLVGRFPASVNRALADQPTACNPLEPPDPFTVVQKLGLVTAEGLTRAEDNQERAV